MAKFRVEYNEDGKRIVDILDDSMTESEKLEVKYAIYKEINDSYRELMRNLPEEKKEPND